MNIVFVHRGGSALATVGVVTAELGCELHVVDRPVGVDALARYAPSAFVVDASVASMDDVCRRLKQDERTAAIPLLVIASPGHAVGIVCDEVLEAPLSADSLSRKLRTWCALHQTWERRVDEVSANTLLVIRRVASLARRARGVFGEQIVLDAAAFGRHLGLSSEDITALEDGARLHDFSDLTLPSTNAELGEVLARYRPELSESLLAPLFDAPFLAIVRHHTERWDGTGFPDALQGPSIPRLARIMRLLVVLDRSTRSGYGPARTLDVLEAEARGGGTDPDLHEAFVRWLDQRTSGQHAHQVET